MQQPGQLPALFLAGPTASGKSELALRLAPLLNCEILTADSMQVYRGMDVGTAKPTPAERALVPHHLLDLVEVDQPFDVAQYLRLAEAARVQVEARGRRALFCGGTGLYFQALARGVGGGPPSDPALRAQIAATPMEGLLAELHAGDPVLYERIDRRNPRRIIRAVEILRLTGHPPSASRSDWTQAAPPGHWLALERDREALGRRIDLRVGRMLEQGLVEETRRLLELGLRKNPVAMQAIGYRQIVEHLDGLADLPGAVEAMRLKTRQFSRRQMTWFRRQLPVRWVAVGEEAELSGLAERLAEEILAAERRGEFLKAKGDPPKETAPDR